MNEVTFSKVCKAFYNHMIKQEMSPIARALLDLFTNQEGLLNEKNEPYAIEVKEYIEFFKGETDIYPKIKTFVKNTSYQTIEDGIIKIFDDLVIELEHDDVAEELRELIKQDTKIEDWQRNSILTAADSYETAAKTLIYAIGNNNLAVPKAPKKKTVNVKSTLNSLIEILKSLPKPVAIEVPDELSITEMTYVSAILEAFAEDLGVQIITQEDLLSKSEYAKYKARFDRYRRDYYAAESNRESLKDTILSEEADFFEELKNETYDSVIDKVEEDYDTSYQRMVETLTFVSTVPLNTLIAQIPGWVQASQKKGLCHMLVNEERFRWKDE